MNWKKTTFKLTVEILSISIFPESRLAYQDFAVIYHISFRLGVCHVYLFDLTVLCVFLVQCGCSIRLKSNMQ